MTKYVVIAKVDQIVTKEVKLVVEASSAEEAVGKSRLALNEYPQEVSVEDVKRIVTQKATFWIPRNVDFVSVKEDKD